MPISICQLYSDVKGRENTWQGGHLRPASFESWVHEVQIEISNELVKELGNNQTLTDNLRGYLRSVQLPILLSVSGGTIKYPKDYRRFSSLRFFSKTQTGEGVLCKDIDIVGEDGQCRPLTEEEKAEALNQSELCERRIDMIDNQFWGSICDDKIAIPSLKIPYATQMQNGFKVLPKAVGYVVLDYVSLPERPKLLYTVDGRHNFTCLPGSSSLIFGEEMLPEFLARLKKRYSAFTRNESGYQQGESERQITTS